MVTQTSSATQASSATRATMAIQASSGTALTNPVEPRNPAAPDADGLDDGEVTVSVPGQRSQVLSIILLVSVIGVAPSVLLLCTSFTKLVVVMSLTRSALGTPSVPPNQVLVGLSLFLSLFIMGPTADAINEKAIQPYSKGDMNVTQAYRAGSEPLRDFMLKHTRDEELALMTKAAGMPMPESRQKVELRTLVPAFVLSELRGAFIIGFVIFIPFLVIDIVVSAILMSLGMVMLPPALVSLPFKLLLFVLVDGWSLIVTTLIGSYR
ncbi:flagellar type III secretion system pore protein FliP [Kineosporia sp. J2-2]|uniref:Flagellar biosynthetic protein FliP n=2 Tax=Kineosporia corallincola TaxID=2835133 RepID=A0ABS5TK59_9ACTN|nr:flagellar type III secretion system pore protein FliP [Kineosporia corallincola]